MAIKHRKDLRGRALRDGEFQRRDNKLYVYCYTNPLGIRRSIYASDLATLRKKEDDLKKAQLDGLDTYAQGRATINSVFDRYMSIKPNLRKNTRQNYLYLYDHFVRETFGKKKIAEIKYSDVVAFYNYLLFEKKVGISTIDSLQVLLHPTFQLAVRDGIILANPTDHATAELKKNSGLKTGVRHALTPEQQEAFMGYIAEHPVYCHWWPLFTVLLGTGTRIGECLGLTWDDLDFEKQVIRIDHALVYYSKADSPNSYIRIAKPKTDAGIRWIPMLDVVKDAFEIIKEEQESNPVPKLEIDGYSDFIFRNRFGNMLIPPLVNDAIRRISSSYNAEEELNAKRENRVPVIIPHFSCHHLRHTFATRLCESENNLKVIQSIMGHRSITTTMDVYAECTEQKKVDTFENLAEKMNKLF
jgi:integrase